MKHHLIKYLSQFVKLNSEEIRIIEKHGTIRQYEKGDILLKEGQIARESFLVLKGCVNSYFLEEGEKCITEFFLENELIIPVGYSQQTSSTHSLACVENSVVSVGTLEKTEQFLKLVPKFNRICLQISNDLLAKKQILFDDYRFYSPELRYLKFIKNRPELINRVPQYMIASYLGIKPQSLSRIRKRLSGKV